MNQFVSYSIVIRTLGNSGDKYRRMLDSISALSVRPEEVIVVIPEGYELDHTLGWERVVRSKKGMVVQRVIGIDECRSDYMLVLDDDIIFPSDFVEKIHEHLVNNQLDCTLSFGGWSDSIIDHDHNPQPLKKRFRDFMVRVRGAYTGQYYCSYRKSDYFDVITSTAGHRTFENSSDKLCQAGCFQCFFIKTKAARSVHLEDDLWLQEGTISNYAAYDDAVFFYKLFLQGGRMSYVNNTGYCHLDAAAGRVAMSMLDRKRIRLYSIAKNRTVFWYKYIFKTADSCNQRLKALIGGCYGLLNYAFYSIVVNLNPKYWKAIIALLRGYKDAVMIIKKK